MDIEERKRRMEKIHKCMRLSSSSNPHEAAAALRQAQKMMQAWNITDADLTDAGFTMEQVPLPVQVNKKMVPNQISALCALIRKAFGVRCVVSHSKRQSDVGYDIKIFGPELRVPMAAYACTVVYRACNSSWTKFLKENSHLKGNRGARALFMCEWIDGVRETVEACGFSDAEQLGTQRAIDIAYDGKKLGQSKNMNVRGSSEAADAGRAAAAGFSLHRPMDTNRNKLGNF